MCRWLSGGGGEYLFARHKIPNADTVGAEVQQVFAVAREFRITDRQRIFNIDFPSQHGFYASRNVPQRNVTPRRDRRYGFAVGRGAEEGQPSWQSLARRILK